MMLEIDTGSLKSELFCKISERKSDGDDVTEKRPIETVLLNSKSQAANNVELKCYNRLRSYPVGDG
jgi:hypothetical protein